jgi:hypothetical protein
MGKNIVAYSERQKPGGDAFQQNGLPDDQDDRG